ncbi:MAG: FmdB family zinc ribbon protein [Nitrosotalea sp.]
MNPKISQNNVPRNVIILATIVTVLFGMFRLVLFLILVWVAALAFIVVYQYNATRRTRGNFVCLDCATIHQDPSCPKCGSRLKKIYSQSDRYGV